MLGNMTLSRSRRGLLACCLAAPFASPLFAQTVSRDWLLGTWQSNRERTMDNWRFRADVPDPKPETRQRMAEMFGHLRYVVSPQYFAVRDQRMPTLAQDQRWRYAVLSATDSSMTLRFSTRHAPPLTLFRESEDVLFIRAGRNLEFFTRV